MSIHPLSLMALGCYLALSGLPAGVATTQDAVTAPVEGLRIHLPREVSIEENAIELGQVSVLRGDASLVAKAKGLGLGLISVPGQKVVLDRTVILSRLASNGVPANLIKITGAQSVAVARNQRIITGREFVQLAKSFLGATARLPGVCDLRAVRTPQDLVLSGQVSDLQLTPALVANPVRNQARVDIAVAVDGTKVAERRVLFGLKYKCRNAVTFKQIPAAGALTPENIKVVTVVSNLPEPAGWKPPYGLVARRQLPANTTIRASMVETVRPAVVIKRNETIVIRLQRPGLLVTAMGTALQEGRYGDLIKVRNVDSRRIILCKVTDDGTVEPIF